MRRLTIGRPDETCDDVGGLGQAPGDITQWANIRRSRDYTLTPFDDLEAPIIRCLRLRQGGPKYIKDITSSSLLKLGISDQKYIELFSLHKCRDVNDE